MTLIFLYRSALFSTYSIWQCLYWCGE